MNLKKIFCAMLSVLLLLSCLTGCQSTADPTPATQPDGTVSAEPLSPTEPRQTETGPDSPVVAISLSSITNARELGFSAFDNQLVEYLKQSGWAEENFTVSPLSFKAALTLAALGAEGDTQAQLLHALGYECVDALRAWYATVLAGTDSFASDMDRLLSYADSFPASGSSERSAAYQVVNSVWSNQDLPGAFRQSFLDDIEKTCAAEANSAPALSLAEAVNAWVNEKTKGLIPQILSDASKASAILVNALYLKSGWETPFIKLGDQDFTTRSGETVQKPFMRQRTELDYYRDEQTQLVSVPLQGGVSMVFVLGDDTGLAEKLGKAESRLVELTVPMFDVETTLDQRELVNYLLLMGCDRMFSKQAAQFDPMYTEPLYVDDIVQKAKVHIDEEGLEAAAVTAMVALAAGMPSVPETPEIFCADRPFSFYILKDGESSELLFWGQIVK